LGDNTGAILDYTQAIALDPKCADAYNNRGNAKSALGDNTGAISDYTQAIALNPQDALAYYNRGRAKALLRDKAGAFADLEKAKQLFVAQGDMESYQEAIRMKNLVSDMFAH
jgi:tetratricopeptide (TPR) repeat protein